MAIELSVDDRRKIIAENSWAEQAVRGNKTWQVFNRGHGVYLQDEKGKEYIDAVSGQYCAMLGHGNKRVIKAIEEQLEAVQFPEQLRSDAPLRLMQRIAELTPGDLKRVFLGVTGSDTVEAAMSLARSFFRKQGKSNSMIIGRWHSYHGHAAGAVGLTHTEKHLQGRDMATTDHGIYHMPAPYCYRCWFEKEYPSCGILCARALENVIQSMGPENVVAFIGEPIFGAGGGIEPPVEYWPMIRDICNKYGILLILDEVITGWGKTGKLFACNHWDVVPDIMCCAKGISSAYLPMSATICAEHVYKALDGEWPYYGHTHTYYPAGAAAAVATIDVIMEDKLWENAAKVGAHLKHRLQEICQKSAIVGTVHGMGLLLGAELVEDKASKTPWARGAEMVKLNSRDKGALVFARGFNRNIVEISPPLIMNMAEADKLCDILAEAIKEVESTKGLGRRAGRTRPFGKR